MDIVTWFILFFAQFEPNRNIVQLMYIGLNFLGLLVFLFLFFFVEGIVVYKQNVLYLITEPLIIS